MKRNSIDIVATNGKPTLYFLINSQLKQLLLLNVENSKHLKFQAFDSFKLKTKELIKYEV